MHSSKKLIVFVSREVARDLVRRGIASSVFAALISDTLSSTKYDYAWHILTNDVHVYYALGKQAQDDLARELILLPTIKAREVYLNELWKNK